MNRRYSAIGFMISGLLMPLQAWAAEPSCADETYARLGQEERLYRSVIFGLATAEDMPINGVVTDKEGDRWIKTADNEWRSTDAGYQGTTWSDTLVEDERDVPARRGILEIRKALSSELVPSVLQSIRAMQCRMQAVCLTAQLTPTTDEGQPVIVQPEGCIEFTMPQMTACRTREFSTFDSSICSTELQSIIDRETSMMELLLAYDASYRTLMQFAGTFEGFLSDFRFPLLQPLWQMVRTFGQFDNLPCFLAECNE